MFTCNHYIIWTCLILPNKGSNEITVKMLIEETQRSIPLLINNPLTIANPKQSVTPYEETI